MYVAVRMDNGEFHWRACVSPLDSPLTERAEQLTPSNARAASADGDIGARREFSVTLELDADSAGGHTAEPLQ